MRINKFLYIAIGVTAALTAVDADARFLSADQALERAIPGVKRLAPTKDLSSPKLISTIECQGVPTVYVMGSKSSTLFLSADDMAPALLGYTDGALTGDYPPALNEWLQTISKDIRSASEDDNELIASARAAEDRKEVAPLISTKWNQQDGFDIYTPIIQEKKSPTGCVATAMAQILYYYKYPERPVGSITYYTNIESGVGDYTFDFDAQPNFDYINMLPKYNKGEYNDIQSDAVSRLMIACGRASKMLYHWSQSATTISDAAYGLVNYLQFDPNIHLAFRRCYTLAEWQSLLEDELLQQRPILFSGTNDGGGHCFLLDGFNEDGYFHVNWGWAGTSDGYFFINGLTPRIQGAGGSDSGYNKNQIAALNVRPLQAESFTHLEAPTLMLSDWGCPAGTYARTDKFTPMRWLNNNYLGENGWMNTASYDFAKHRGIKFVNADDEVYYYFEKVMAAENWIPGDYYSSFILQPRTNPYGTGIDIPNGSYKAYPVCRSADEYGAVITDVEVVYGNRNYVNVTVTDDNVVVSYPEEYVPSLGSDRPVLESPLYPGQPARIRINFKNYGPEYYNTVNLSLKESYYSTSTTSLGHIFINVPANSEAEYEWVGTVPAGLKTGGYYLIFNDYKGQSFGTMSWIEIEEKPEEETTVSISDLTFHNRMSGSGVNYDPHTLNGNTLDFSFNLNCHTGYFVNPISVRLRQGMTDVKSIVMPNNYVKTGTCATVSGAVTLSELEYDCTYGFNVVEKYTTPSGYAAQRTLMPTSAYFRMQPLQVGIDTPAIEMLNARFEGDMLVVESNMPMGNVSLYDATGMLIFTQAIQGAKAHTHGVDNLPAGMYILRVDDKFTIKIMK